MALVALVPVALDPWGWDRFGPVKWLMIALVSFVWVLRAARHSAVAHCRSLTIGWLAVLAVSAVATAVSPDPLLGLLGDASRLYGLLSLLLIAGAYLVGCSTGLGSATAVARALVVGAAVVAAYGIVQMVGWDPLRWSASLDTSRARSTLGNAAFLGGYLTLVLPVAVLQSTNRNEPHLWRRLHAITFVGGLVVMAGTKTRGSWIGLVVGFGMCAWLARRYVERDGDAARRRPVEVALAVAAAGAVAVAAGLFTPLGPRALSTLDPSSGTAAGRLDTWAVSVDLIRQRPMLGWGPEGFRIGFPGVVDREWVARYGQDQVQDRAHNLFLDTAATTGIVGVGAYCALLAALARIASRAVRAGRREIIGIVGGLVGYLVHAQFLFDTFDLGVAFWTLAGVLAAEAGLVTTWRPRRPLLACGGAVAGLAVVWGGVGVAADHRVRDAQPGPPARVAAELARAAALRPRSLEYHLLAGRVGIDSNDVLALNRAHDLLRSWPDRDVRLADAGVLTKIGAVSGRREHLVAAAAAYESILAKEPFAGLAWLGLGEARLRLNQPVEARDALLEAADLLPRSPEPALALGFLALAQGQKAEAARHLATAGRIAPGDARVADLRRALAPG